MSTILSIIQIFSPLYFAALDLPDVCHDAGILHGEAVLVRDRGVTLETALADARSTAERLALKKVYSRPD
ncbi:MAG: hypothetical protein EB015_20430, partial [Methylocystaceae bacterium]|nr:hypothetical protein [Methylocystaceae bacterium]